MCIVLWLVCKVGPHLIFVTTITTVRCVNKCSQVSHVLIGTQKTALHTVLLRIYALSSEKFLPQIGLLIARSRLSQVRTFVFLGKGSVSYCVWLVGW